MPCHYECDWIKLARYTCKGGDVFPSGTIVFVSFGINAFPTVFVCCLDLSS